MNKHKKLQLNYALQIVIELFHFFSLLPSFAMHREGAPYCELFGTETSLEVALIARKLQQLNYYRPQNFMFCLPAKVTTLTATGKVGAASSVQWQ